MTPGKAVAPALRALLRGTIDYAGLFPPAALALEPALDNHAAYARGADAWMLGCFVLPVARLAEAGPLLAGRFDAQCPLCLSALGTKTASANAFLSALDNALRALVDFQRAHGPAVRVGQLEAPLPTDVAPGPVLRALLREAAGRIAATRLPLRAFWEVPFSEDLPARLRVFADHNATSLPPFGAKLRTGGLEAAAFPSTAQLAAAFVATRAAGVALKFTAGLHHPFRRFDAGINAHMHGFVNAFAAGVFCYQDADETLLQALLDDEDPASFTFAADTLRWRDQHAQTRGIAEARAFFTSFGSCSFDEPRDDLRAVHLLP